MEEVWFTVPSEVFQVFLLLEVHKEWHHWDREAQITALGTGVAAEVDRSISDRAILLEGTSDDNWHIVGDWSGNLDVVSMAVEEKGLEC